MPRFTYRRLLIAMAIASVIVPALYVFWDALQFSRQAVAKQPQRSLGFVLYHYGLPTAYQHCNKVRELGKVSLIISLILLAANWLGTKLRRKKLS